MVKCANKFFRTLIHEGVLMQGDVCTTARVAGAEMNAIW
jgi:hypothetical protein